jgi:hypothetical protein
MYEHRSAPLMPFRAFVWRVASHFLCSTALVAGSLLMGMAGYMSLAHMRAVDAFLNASMILGGMGPVGDLPTSAAKIFAGCYALYAGIIFIVSASILVAPVAHRMLHTFHLEGDSR